MTALQLGALMLAIRMLELERAFGLVAITPVVFLGFCAHAWLPSALKPPAFVALSLTAFVVVLGAAPAAILVGVVLAVVGTCHLPIAFAARLALLAAAGVGMTALRAGWIASGWAAAVLPVAASMLMFRLVIYLYDERTAPHPASLWMRLSYFFLLPNVCFLLFPVVDYRTFQRTYYDEPAHRIHERGIAWILRGVVHLLLYRVVYFHLTPVVGEIHDFVGVARFVVSSYLLYLRISGHFHLAVGVLHLFGFHLPETNHRYLFATSFTDCWRRINVYWTEFMKKIVYYPAFMRMRRRGTVFAMVGATALTFLATWLLHAYQWFWLQGAFPLATDGLFWGLAGSLAIITALLEAKHGRGPTLAQGPPSWRRALRRSLQAAGVFCLIALIWSLWCSGSLEQWLEILAQARHGTPAQALLLGGGALAIVAVATVAQRVPRGLSSGLTAGRTLRVVTAAGVLTVALLGVDPVRAAAGASFASAAAPVVHDYPNRRDRERVLLGYYDRLVQREGFGGRAEEVRPQHDWKDAIDADLLADVLRQHELPPSLSITYLGVPFETNSLGMRDRERTLSKPPETVRIVLLGTCYGMGSGVAADDQWSAIAEARLNAELSPRTGKAYEILNFSVVGSGLLEQLTRLGDKAARFTPDLVLLTNHYVPDARFLLRVFAGNVTPNADVAAILARAGVTVTPGLDPADVRRLVGPRLEVIERMGLRAIAERCRKMGARPALLVVPLVDSVLSSDRGRSAEVVKRTANASRIGYRVLSIDDAFDGNDYDSLTLNAWSHLPSPRAHRLLADALFEVLRSELAVPADGDDGAR